ncbi:MAG: universal stress protein [Candidatus Sulfotelmatobacter sp.]
MKTVEAGERIALKSVLFATDFSSHSDLAMPYAAAIARHYGAKLYGAHVVSSEDYLFTAPDLWPAHMEQEKQLQNEVVQRIDQSLGTIPHEALFGVGDVWSVISRFLEEHSIDLLVVGTHGRTGTRKLLVGSIAEKLFRQAPCPVLSVGPNVASKSERQIEFRRILFATNFGQQSLAALPYALSFAEEDQSELVLLHVVTQPPAGISNVEEVKASLKQRLEALVPPEAESWCRPISAVEFGHQFARPAERIVDVARERAVDLIVLGVRPTSSAISTVTHLTHTTAQHVLAHAPCPVLTVRG